MSSLSPVSRRERVRKLKVLGFKGPFPGGRHQWMRRVIRRILRQAGISLEEWISA
jgi:hypothetical protein